MVEQPSLFKTAILAVIAAVHAGHHHEEFNKHVILWISYIVILPGTQLNHL
jgi:hypothetical protein